MRRLACFFLLLVSFAGYATTETDLSRAANPDTVFTVALSDPLHRLYATIADVSTGNGNPMLELQQVGEAALDAGEAIWTTVAGTRITKFSALKTALPLLQPVSVFLLQIGFQLGILLPFLPFVLTMTAISIWIFHVIAGVVTIPFLVFRGISRHNPMIQELLLSFLIHSMLRPALIVLGLTLGAAVTCSALYVLLIMWQPVVGSFPVSMSGMIGAVVTTMILARLAISVATLSFSMVITLPDQAMRFFSASWRALHARTA